MHNTEEHNRQDKGAAHEARLARRAKGGSHEAFDLLSGRYRPLLLALAFLRTGNREEAQDLVQDVLTKAWRRIGTLHDPEAFLPWVKAIAANACNSWYRRPRVFVTSLDDAASQQFPVNRELMPLEAMLARETQRELWRAMLALPEANRIALLMHVWDGSTYEDIAAVTGVRLTTVEGRIYRAKRQLCRLLSAEGAELLGAPRRKYQADDANRGNAITDVVVQPRRQTMKQAALPEMPQQNLPRAFQLAQFTHQFSVMIDAGVSLVRTLIVLQDLPPPYGEAVKAITKQVEDGVALSEAMSQRPDLFSNLYIALIRAGEVGGILEETLQHAWRLVAKERQLARRRPGNEEPLLLINPANKPLPGDWVDLSAYQQTMTLILFSEMFGMLLQSRVPILQVMEILSALLPEKQAEALTATQANIREGERIGEPMQKMGIFPPFAIQMILIGEESGSLHTMLYRIAELLEEELEDSMWQAMRGITPEL